jgi:Rieske Fe-S protein
MEKTRSQPVPTATSPDRRRFLAIFGASCVTCLAACSTHQTGAGPAVTTNQPTVPGPAPVSTGAQPVSPLGTGSASDAHSQPGRALSADHSPALTRSASVSPHGTSAEARTSTHLPTSSTSPTPITSATRSPSPGSLIATTAVPVGGGVILDAANIVITEPTAGTFHGFSNVCTHLGCIVNAIVSGLIDCPCHGSQYSISDGSVVAGPAPRPLPPVPIKVVGGHIYLA